MQQQALTNAPLTAHAFARHATSAQTASLQLQGTLSAGRFMRQMPQRLRQASTASAPAPAWALLQPVQSWRLLSTSAHQLAIEVRGKLLQSYTPHLMALVEDAIVHMCLLYNMKGCSKCRNA
jgi:hypothetical protein